MSVIMESKVQGIKFMVEKFSSANEVVTVSSGRKITNGQFHDERSPERRDPSWTGVQNYEEAVEMMQTGYQPIVDELKGTKVNLQGQGKRISFFNDIMGYAPIVPFAIMGVPTAMVNSHMKPIRAKVVNIYYDMTARAGTDKDKIIEAGQKILGGIMELEMQGYRFNLYAIQSYSSKDDADILCVKIKDSNTPMDLRRMSFPLTHTAFFRVIGFDWYTRTPKGTYREGYGHGLSYDRNQKELSSIFTELFKEKAVFLSCVEIMKQGKEHIKEVLTSGK